MFLVLTGFVTDGFSQKKMEAPQIQRDPILEQDAKHNLGVAWQYFKLKKAYKAVLMRFEETFAAHPDFSKLDEFLYIAGMSSIYLADGKGRQALVFKDDEERKRYSPERLREDALVYLSMVKEKFPNSKYIGETEKQLKLLTGKK